MSPLKTIYEAARAAESAYGNALDALPEQSLFRDFLAKQVEANRRIALEVLNSAPGEVEPQAAANVPAPPSALPALYVDKIGASTGLAPRAVEVLFTLTDDTRQAYPNYVKVGFHCITYNGLSAFINGKYGGVTGEQIFSAVVQGPDSTQDFEEALKHHVAEHIRLVISPYAMYMYEPTAQQAQGDKTRVG